jgi:uncharacterized protein
MALALRLKRVHLPPVGVMTLLLGGILRVVAFVLEWPVLLVTLSNCILLISALWILMYDLFPILLPFFDTIRDKYRRKDSFFIGLILFFVIMQLISTFLPSGRTKDITTTLAFLSFISSIGWFVVANTIVSLTPVTRYLRRQPREIERVTFSDVITSMAVVILPTVVVSFVFTPPGLAQPIVTPYNIAVTSLLTNFFMVGYLYLFIIRPKVFSWRQLGLKKVDREYYDEAIILFVLISTLIFIIQSLLTRLGVPLQQWSFTTTQGGWLAFGVAVLVTPIIEELYFRGFLFRGLMLHHRPWMAFIISAALFAALHPPVLVMVEVFVVGLLLAYVMRETRSIWPGVVIHALNNAIVFGYLLFR